MLSKKSKFSNPVFSSSSSKFILSNMYKSILKNNTIQTF